MRKDVSSLCALRTGCRVVAVSLVALLLLARPGVTEAAGGTVAVSAVSRAAIVSTFDGGPVSFNPPQERDGTDSFLASSAVSVFQDDSGSGASYRVWRGDGSGVTATVKSNGRWSGTIGLDPDGSALPEAAVASGALRYSLIEPKSYADCEGSAVLQTTPGVWAQNHPPGVARFNFYYCLRVEPGDDPAEVPVSIVYRVAQSSGAGL